MDTIWGNAQTAQAAQANSGLYTPNSGGLGIGIGANANSIDNNLYERLRTMNVESTNPRLVPAWYNEQCDRALELFKRRMGGVRNNFKLPNVTDFLQCHVAGDNVYLFYCFGERDGVVKEQVDMFPSDTLLAQFRMILA